MHNKNNPILFLDFFFRFLRANKTKIKLFFRFTMIFQSYLFSGGGKQNLPFLKSVRKWNPYYEINNRTFIQALPYFTGFWNIWVRLAGLLKVHKWTSCHSWEIRKLLFCHLLKVKSETWNLASRFSLWTFIIKGKYRKIKLGVKLLRLL